MSSPPTTDDPPATPHALAARPALPATDTATFADIYDTVVGQDFWPLWWSAFDRAEAEFGIRLQTVCDVACGTGETALRLARRGATVSGVDRCPEMIRVATAKCAGNGVSLTVQRMEALALNTPVDLLVCAYDSLNMLPDRMSLARTLRCFSRALRPGGYALCDVATLRHMADDWGNGEIRATNGPIDSIWHTVWDAAQERLTVHLTATFADASGGISVVRERVVEQAFSMNTLATAIADSGLIPVAVRDMASWTPGTEESSRLFYVLQKPR